MYKISEVTKNATSLNWFIYYTYPKAERVIKKELEKSDLEVFLPLHKIKRQWSDRVKQLEVPLFSNYIFVKSSKNTIYNIIKHPKIVKYVAFEGRPAILKDEEICLIQKFIDIGMSIESDRSIMVGDMVKIKTGPLQGLTGILIEKKGSKRFGIKLRELNQTLSIEINIDNLVKSVLEPIEING
jgi:transcription antitermination factor NusG